jgi:hypothetical protein
MQMSDIRLLVEGAATFYKASVAVTIADLSVHASHLDSLLRTCLAEAGLRCSFGGGGGIRNGYTEYEMCNAPS